MDDQPNICYHGHPKINEPTNQLPQSSVAPFPVHSLCGFTSHEPAVVSQFYLATTQQRGQQEVRSRHGSLVRAESVPVWQHNAKFHRANIQNETATGDKELPTTTHDYDTHTTPHHTTPHHTTPHSNQTHACMQHTCTAPHATRSAATRLRPRSLANSSNKTDQQTTNKRRAMERTKFDLFVGS